MGGSQWAMLAWRVCCPEFDPRHQEGVGRKEEKEEEWNGGEGRRIHAYAGKYKQAQVDHKFELIK